MPNAQARIPTERAARYLAQLCQHMSQMERHAQHGDASDSRAPVHVQRVEWSESHGVIEFASGTCILDAGPDHLAIDLEAADGNELRRMQQMFAARLAMIGRRDKLVVTW